MSDFKKAIKTLEFNKIRELLADCAATEGAKETALSLTPESDTVRIKRMQAETTAARYLISKKSYPSFSAVKNVGDSVEKARKSSVLTPSELLEIANVLRVSRGLIDYIENGNAEETVIDVIFRRLTPNRFLEEKIYRALPSEDYVADEASPTLADLRRRIRVSQGAVRETLQKYVSGAFGKYLQENIVTVRNDRFVVPVKAEYKNEIKGLVHDTSATGATVFIEPYAVVEANNELRELQTKEAREIERILSSLSADCALHGEALLLNYMNITQIAFIFAKARFAEKYEATEPIISEKRIIKLKKARHPLLDAGTVVPITVSLGEDFDTLVITGPNTGGKTVTLKTLGLFALMAQSGLHLPAEEAEIGAFNEILADIGDEQSIEQSLSTFSSHLVNIIKILKCVSRESLVLFDELGAGTDPIEGAALAISVLEEVRSYKGALCAATTHYSELKEYAGSREGVTNAGCEFNIETLKPTYRLIIGAPGRSNAFAISERLGLSKSIIERAERFISSENRRLEETIASLDSKRAELEKMKAELSSERAEFERYEKERREYINELSEKAYRDTQNLREQAARMTESARASATFVFDKLERLQRQEEGKRTRASLEEAREEVRRNLRAAEGSLISVKREENAEYAESRPLKTGDEVMILSVNRLGTVIKPADKDGQVTVRAGIITMKTDIGNLRLNESAGAKPKPKKGAIGKTLAGNTFKAEIDLRGMTGDEAWFAVDKYIDDAFLAGVNSVTLIHGKGTGALRQALWSMLKKEKRVASFRAGNYGEGDYGVTVIELKR